MFRSPLDGFCYQPGRVAVCQRQVSDYEDHLPFLALFLITKVLELTIYLFDPTISGNMDPETEVTEAIPVNIQFRVC